MSVSFFDQQHNDLNAVTVFAGDGDVIVTDSFNYPML